MVQLLSAVSVRAPVQRCFDVIRSIDAHEASSTLIAGRAVGGKMTGLSELGDETTWSARFFGLRFRVRTKVVEMDAPIGFREDRVGGIPRLFGHVYRLTSEGESTRIEDRFEVGLPFGVVGQTFATRVLRGRLGKVQQQRLESIRRICEGEEWRRYLER